MITARFVAFTDISLPYGNYIKLSGQYNFNTKHLLARVKGFMRPLQKDINGRVYASSHACVFIYLLQEVVNTSQYIASNCRIIN
jgi:hypothetical protein